MDYSQFLYMKEELSLIAVILILFVVDLFTCPDQKGATPKVNVRSLTLPAVILMTLHTVIFHSSTGIFPHLRNLFLCRFLFGAYRQRRNPLPRS